VKKLLTVVAFVLLMTSSVWAIADISLGVYGGLNAGIAQQDTKSGTGFGIRAKISPTPMLGGAVFYETRSFGDPEKKILDETRTITTDGGKVTVIGIEALLGSSGGGIGPHFYFMAGVGSYKWKRDGYSDLSKTEYHFGPGLEIGLMPSFGIEGKAKFEIVPTGNGGSRKNILAYVGANYHFSLGVM
jgi:hypothetical protein